MILFGVMSVLSLVEMFRMTDQMFKTEKSFHRTAHAYGKKNFKRQLWYKTLEISHARHHTASAEMSLDPFDVH